jgi:hypothetical protein
MAVQRILLLVAAVAAVALVFGLPQVFEETNDAAVLPVELGDDLAERRAEPPRRERERKRPRRTPTPEATSPPPPPAPAPAPAVPPASDDDDDGGDG